MRVAKSCGEAYVNRKPIILHSVNCQASVRFWTLLMLTECMAQQYENCAEEINLLQKMAMAEKLWIEQSGQLDRAAAREHDGRCRRNGGDGEVRSKHSAGLRQ